MPRVNPPAPLITGDVVRLTIQGLADAQVVETTHDYMGNAPDVNIQADIGIFAAALEAVILPLYLACCSTSYFIQRTVYDVISRNDIRGTVVDQGNFPGTVASAHFPLEITAVTQRITLLKGQHGQGRFEMPAVPLTFVTSLVEANHLNVAGMAAYNALAAAINGGFTGGGFVAFPCIATRPIAPATLVTRAAIVAQHLPRRILGTQRRRYYGRGI